MFAAVAKSIFGSANDRYVRSLGKYVDAVNALEPNINALSDDELRGQTELFRHRLANGEKLFLHHCALCHGPKGEGGRGPMLTQAKLSRDDLAVALSERGIGNSIFYPRPIYDQPVAYLGGQPAFRLMVNLAQQVKPLAYSAVDALGTDLLNAQVDLAIGGKAAPDQALQTAAMQLQERAQRATDLKLSVATGS